MATSKEVVEKILHMPDNRYFGDPTDFSDLEDALLDSEFYGIALNGPADVSMDVHRAIPLLLALKETGIRGWEVTENKNSVLAATDTHSRVVYIGSIFREPPGKTPMPNIKPPPKPTGASANSEIAGVNLIDARNLLTLPNEPALYRFTAINFDWKSNTVSTEITSSKRPTPQKKPMALTATSAATQNGLPTWLGETPASTTLQGNPPAAALHIDVGTPPAPRVKVVGAVTVFADAALVAQRPYMMDEVGGVKKKVVAHIPATVAVFIKNSTHPFRQDMVIPVYGETSVKTGDILTGHFTVDLLPDGKPLLPAGEYVAYLFVEGQTFGPERFELLPAPK